MLKKNGFVAVVFCLLSSALSAQTEPAQVYSAQQLQHDFRYMLDAIDKTHPDVGYTADNVQLNAAYKSIESQLTKPMTRDEFWRLLSTLNPVYADAHLVIGQPDRQGQMEAHLKTGGRLFPYEVHIDATGEVFVRAELGGKASAFTGQRIDAINGVPARQIAQELLNLTHGDTAGFRASVLARRWWFFYWKRYGAPLEFDLRIANADGTKLLRIPGSINVPSLQKSALDFEQSYRFELLPGNVALLTVENFLWPDKSMFYAFTEQVFAKIRAEKVNTLLIDVRENPGGDDDMWKQGILKYIADKPYQHGSTYRKKVIEGRQNETEKLGAVIHGAIQTWEQPELNNPLHFAGKVYVLYGRYTYSSAILFSNTVQDFGFATLVGAKGLVRTGQTGSVQNFLLPNTGLDLGTPRFILARPSGAEPSLLVTPDVVLADDPFNSRGLIDALLDKIRGNEPSLLQ